MGGVSGPVPNPDAQPGVRVPVWGRDENGQYIADWRPYGAENPWNCAEPGCAHLPAAHEVDGRGGGLGPCHGRPASERRWWRRRLCDCAGYVPRKVANRG